MENKAAAGAEQEYYRLYIAAGRERTVGIDSDGHLWSWGKNENGQLGDGTTTRRITPVRVQQETEEGIFVDNTTKWKAVSAGGERTVGIDSDGHLWSWGKNENGQLGDGTTANKSTPVRVQQETEEEIFVDNTTEWKAVSVGFAHTVGIDSNETLWSWGKNSGGQLGDGTKIDKSIPVRVQQAGITWKAVAAGGGHTVGLAEDGSLWSWGYNESGQLGLGNLGTDASGAAITQISLPQKIGNKTWSAVAVSLGAFSFTVGIDSDGTLWSWGYNGNGQLGDGTKTDKSTPVRVQQKTEEGAFVDNRTKWKAVAAGGGHTVGLAEDGTLWSWGYNGNGQLGDGTTAYKSTPVRVQQKTEAEPFEDNMTKWESVSAGEDHTVGIAEDGTLWSWGKNEFGQLGDSTTTDKNTPVKIQIPK